VLLCGGAAAAAASAAVPWVRYGGGQIPFEADRALAVLLALSDNRAFYSHLLQSWPTACHTAAPIKLFYFDVKILISIFLYSARLLQHDNPASFRSMHPVSLHSPDQAVAMLKSIGRVCVNIAVICSCFLISWSDKSKMTIGKMMVWGCRFMLSVIPAQEAGLQQSHLLRIST